MQQSKEGLGEKKSRRAQLAGEEKSPKTWLAAWQQALQRDLHAPDSPNEGICESLKKCLFLYATNDKTVSHKIRGLFIFFPGVIAADIFNHLF